MATTPSPDVEHLFRHSYARVVAMLANKYSPQYIEPIEDAVQEALIRAMQSWPFGKTPNNPAAWLYRVANNALLDHLRRASRLVPLDVHAASELQETPEFAADQPEDEQLSMIFACCHPSLKLEEQLMLSLKLLGGLNVREISTALFKKPETVKKALTRAKEKFRTRIGNLEIPLGEGLLPRFQAVLKVLYLMFNEGYKAAEGDELVRQDMCGEAIRLGLMLRNKPALNLPDLNALLALMCFHAARFNARQDENGQLVQLKNQDRTLWIQELINRGQYYLESSLNGFAFSEYHLLAMIAAHYTTAPSFAETDWRAILFLYDQLVEANPSAVVALNRAVVVEKVHGPEKALAALDQIAADPAVQTNHLYYAIRADFECSRGNEDSALELLEMGKKYTKNRVEQVFYQKTMDEIVENHCCKQP